MNARWVPAAAFLLAAAFPAAADGWFPGAPVSVRDGRLAAGDEPVALACADGVPLPEPDAADALADRLAVCGFNAVRLPDAAAPKDVERLAAFSAACAWRGIRLWADALVPALAVPPSPADAALIDDPATEAAWTNALAEAAANGFDPFLAAPWDPRLESLLQHRLRDWARAFNPATGLRRLDEPAWALVGFSSGWRNAFLFSASATNAPVPPAFFRDGFLAEWNVWLYDRYGTDERAAAILLPGESVASNAVAWIGSPFGAPPDDAVPAERIHDEKLFLHHLYQPHAKRLVHYFRATGGNAETVPAFVRWGEGPRSLPEPSGVRFLAEAPGPGVPTIAFFPADGGPFSLEPRPSVVVFPCAAGPEPFAAAARFVRTALVSSNGVSTAFDGTTVDRPDAAVAVFALESRRLPSGTLRFGATGAALQLRALGPGERPDGLAPEPPGPKGLSVLLWLPPEATENRDREGAGFSVEAAFAPDAPFSLGAPMNVFARVRDAETGADVPFGLVVTGPALRKRAWRDFSPGAAPDARPLPDDRVLRLPAAAGPRLLVFPFETVESDLLKRLEEP